MTFKFFGCSFAGLLINPKSGRFALMSWTYISIGLLQSLITVLLEKN